MKHAMRHLCYKFSRSPVSKDLFMEQYSNVWLCPPEKGESWSCEVGCSINLSKTAKWHPARDGNNNSSVYLIRNSKVAFENLKITPKLSPPCFLAHTCGCIGTKKILACKSKTWISPKQQKLTYGVESYRQINAQCLQGNWSLTLPRAPLGRLLHTELTQPINLTHHTQEFTVDPLVYWMQPKWEFRCQFWNIR